jgi:hypothetical protein
VIDGGAGVVAAEERALEGLPGHEPLAVGEEARRRVGVDVQAVAEEHGHAREPPRARVLHVALPRPHGLAEERPEADVRRAAAHREARRVGARGIRRSAREALGEARLQRPQSAGQLRRRDGDLGPAERRA